MVVRDFQRTSIKISPHDIIMESKTVLTQYIITYWSLELVDKSKLTGRFAIFSRRTPLVNIFKLKLKGFMMPALSNITLNFFSWRGTSPSLPLSRHYSILINIYIVVVNNCTVICWYLYSFFARKPNSSFFNMSCMESDNIFG